MRDNMTKNGTNPCICSEFKTHPTLDMGDFYLLQFNNGDVLCLWSHHSLRKNIKEIIHVVKIERQDSESFRDVRLRIYKQVISYPDYESWSSVEKDKTQISWRMDSDKQITFQLSCNPIDDLILLHLISAIANSPMHNNINSVYMTMVESNKQNTS